MIGRSVVPSCRVGNPSAGSRLRRFAWVILDELLTGFFPPDPQRGL
jgi:hypothetical protein